MKKLLSYSTVFFLVFCLCSCGKGIVEQGESESGNQATDEAYQKAQEIYRLTGCKVINAQTINTLNEVFIDSKGYKYLYGARNAGINKVFWFSKYDLKGDLIWENNTHPENENYSWAYLPKELSNGNIVVGCVVGEDDSPTSMAKTMFPTILSQDDGSAIFIKVLDRYLYSYINVYDNCFICGIDKEEIDLNPNATLWFSQISNNGNIIQSKREMELPYGNTIWKDETNFVSANNAIITKRNTADITKTWKFYPQLPYYNSYSSHLSFEEDNIIASYDLTTVDGVVKYTYKILYNTGRVIESNNPNDEDKFDYLDFGKEYLAPDNMTVTMNSIDIINNNQGTTYYKIDYTLKNNTKSDIIPEGSFEAYYNLFTKGDFQTGFFNDLFPGESRMRTYTFKTLSNAPFMFIQYKHEWNGSESEILKTSLKWKADSNE